MDDFARILTSQGDEDAAAPFGLIEDDILCTGTLSVLRHVRLTHWRDSLDSARPEAYQINSHAWFRFARQNRQLVCSKTGAHQDSQGTEPSWAKSNHLSWQSLQMPITGRRRGYKSVARDCSHHSKW